MKVLVVDDQRSARLLLADIFDELPDVELLEADSTAAARKLIQAESPDLLLLDIRLSDDIRDRGGLDILRWARESGITTPAVMVTASTELAGVREAMRLGAQDYVLKDEMSPEMLLPVVEGIRERLALRGEVARLRERIDRTWGAAAIIGSSPAMDRVRRLVGRVADADVPVLLRGETGTGKELVARALHELGRRREHPFVAVNCSALPAQLMESLLFGHERGAFTGADRRARGQLELAGSGTVLLDEIAEMPLELQAKLLRVLEERRFRPLGAETESPLRARIVAATHVDLERRIGEQRFREDLYYRLNVVAITLPSLEERGEDLVELVTSFLAQMPRRLRFTEPAMAWLRRRRWPGNVRELKNTIDRIALLAENDVVDVSTLEELAPERGAKETLADVDRLARAVLATTSSRGSRLDELERRVVQQAMELAGGNKSAAARLIGIERKALERRWERIAGAGADEHDESD